MKRDEMNEKRKNSVGRERIEIHISLILSYVSVSLLSFQNLQKYHKIYSRTWENVTEFEN